MIEDLRPSVDSDPVPVATSNSPAIRVVVTPVEGADLNAALAAIRRQAYDHVVDVMVVDEKEGDTEDVVFTDSVESAIADTDSSIDYLWILHADARPRPDALDSLVREVERHDAGLGASKLLRAGTRDELESIGSATDVFGEPYTGLDVGEVDLQQYDVVREVAFVDSVSMLVRRDLARGLGGLDINVPPAAAGLDFSQRARLAGGMVIIVPSSEVYHQDKCIETGTGWHERGGRLRAMIIAYRPLTLSWVLPLSLLVGLLDSLLNLLMLRWRPLVGYVLSVAWNIFHIPSTLKRRRRTNAIRSVGDEELFRFQTTGSVRLRSIGDEISALVLLMFDDDQALSRGAKRIFRSPGIIGAVVAIVLVLIASRGLIFSGIPNSGFNFPFEPPSHSLARFVGGWNESGLGSPAPVHPMVGFTGLVSLLWFGAEGSARTLLTIGLGFVALVGMGRLLGRLGLRGPGRYLAGLVAIAGPGTSALAGRGSWSALAGAAILPWALRAVFFHPAEDRSRVGAMGWALVIGWITAAVSPALLIIPILGALIWWAHGGHGARVELALSAAVGGVVAASFLSGDPGWMLDPSRRFGIDTGLLWSGLILVSVLPLFVSAGRDRRIAAIGGLLALGSLVLARTGVGGPGVEEAALVTASVGAAIVVGLALNRFDLRPLPIVAALGSTAILVISIGSLLGGTLGLHGGDVNDELAFAEALVDDGEARRVLYMSQDRSFVPAESRPGPRFWYRVLDGAGTTSDEVWLPEERAGDRELDTDIAEISTGGFLRPGSILAEYGIGWIVVTGPETDVDVALTSQLDVIPVPLDSEVRVYENSEALPIARDDEGFPWRRVGMGFEGDIGSGRVAIAVNHTPGWEPAGGQVDWFTSVSASTGSADYSGHSLNILLGYASLLVLVGGVALIGWGRGSK